jgi:hypothetical protein
MQIDSPPQADMFRTEVASGAERVDRTKNIIFGASLMQEGDLNDDRDWTVDGGSLANALDLMERTNAGSKARFTHPNMSADGMGSYLGRWKNPRIDGDTLRADLHLADAAFTSPNGDLGTYVMDMAEEDPEAFGISLATRINNEAMKKLKLEKQAADENWKGRTPLRFRAVHAADVVDDPAATRGGFFSLSEIDNRNLPAQATMLLDSYFSDAEPDVVTARINGFLTTYFKAKGKTMPVETAPEPTKTETKPEPVVQVDLSAERTAAADVARKEERERVTKITALCTQAGKPELAAKFSEAGTSVADVQSELFNVLCRSNTAVGEEGGSGETEKSDENSKYRAEFKAGKYSMTESEYISLRRIDDGIDKLMPAAK